MPFKKLSPYWDEPLKTIICSKCGQEVKQGVMIVDTEKTGFYYGDEEILVKVYCCKSCFKKEFVSNTK